MNLSKAESLSLLHDWLEHWNNHDLAGVMKYLADDIVFGNFTGEMVHGKEQLQRAWLPWFLKHGDFRFTVEDVIFDETDQKMVFQWRLEWPSPEKAYHAQPETRQGVDILHFTDGIINRKFSYSKTCVRIDGKLISLKA